VKFKDMEIIAI